MKDNLMDKQVLLAKVREKLFEQIKAGAKRKAYKCPGCSTFTMHVEKEEGGYYTCYECGSSFQIAPPTI